MVHDTRALGFKTRQMGWENYITLMVMYTRESGEMTKLTERALTLLPMVLDTKAIGLMTNSTDSVLRIGLTTLFMKGFTMRARRMAKASLLLLMVPFTKGNSK